MEFSAFLVFAVWTSSMTYLTFGKERERAMVFPDYYFFAERCLVNHTIEKKRVNNLDDCELMCYLNDDCVSLNFKKDPDHICELNNATHVKYDSDFTTDANFYYRGSKNACDKSPRCENNATCQSGFTLKGYRCLCPPGFEGQYCEKADPCNNYKELSDANRKSSYHTPVDGPMFCDAQLAAGWYRFMGAAGAKMPTKHVPTFRCGTAFSGWLDGRHPTVEDGEAPKKVCFSNKGNIVPKCKKTENIFVKNCGSYFIYKLGKPPSCDMRYCGTD